MRIYSSWLVCLMLILVTLISCHKDLDLVPDDATSLETKDFRNRYIQKVAGSWEYVRQADSGYQRLIYTFADNDVLEGHHLLKTRDSVMVNGERVVTDWKTIIDEDFSGKWDLRHLSSENINVIYLRNISGYAQKDFLEFYDVNDSILKIQFPFYSNDVVEMRRIVGDTHNLGQ